MSDFVNQIRAFKEKCKSLSIDVHKNATLGLQKVIIDDTPVLTGRLQSNWQVTQDSPAQTSLYKKVTSVLSFRSYAIGSEYDYQKTINDAEVELSNLGIDQTTFITNLVNYVIPIEFEGYSKYKAPKGMARINIQKWGAIVRRALAKTKAEYG